MNAYRAKTSLTPLRYVANSFLSRLSATRRFCSQEGPGSGSDIEEQQLSGSDIESGGSDTESGGSDIEEQQSSGSNVEKRTYYDRADEFPFEDPWNPTAEELESRRRRRMEGENILDSVDEEPPKFGYDIKEQNKDPVLPSYTGKVALPTTRSLYTVLRSPHIDKKSREQFEMKVRRQLLFIKAKPHELQNKLFWLKRQAVIGAQYEVIVSYQTRLGDLKKILNNPTSKKGSKAPSPATKA